MISICRLQGLSVNHLSSMTKSRDDSDISYEFDTDTYPGPISDWPNMPPARYLIYVLDCKNACVPNDAPC